jgi:tetratricopeptide (TPR) repeat protein
MQKQLFGLILAALLLGAASIAMAQEAAQPTPADEEKTELYRKYYEGAKGNAEQQKIAYDIAREYLKKYGGDSDQYVTAVRKWIAKYEATTRVVEFNQAVAAKDYTKTFTVGRQLLEQEPENFKVLLQLVNAGLLNARAGNKSLDTETIALTRKTLQLVDSKKVTDPAPMASLDDVRGFLNFTLGSLLQETAPADAIAAFLRAAKDGGVHKTDPTTYFLLGATIYNKEYEPLAKEYSEKYTGKDETPESKAMLEKANAIANRAIDAMARAVALATKPEYKDSKATWLAQLTDIYKDFHNNTDAGLNDLISTVLSKPLP